MRKVSLWAMLLCATSLSFVSCGGSDGDNEEQQQPTVQNVLVGKWKMTKVIDFPIPINSYYLEGENYVTFLDNGKMIPSGEFSVVTNGEAARPMTLPFTKYFAWSADKTSDDGAIAVYLGESKDLYVGYINSTSSIDLVKFAESKSIGITYRLEKQ